MKVCRYIALICAIALLASFMLPVSVQADQTNTVYIRKHISFLYDNSGSMREELQGADNLKWSYASYAAQVFAGLLNDTDSLSFTFMNQTNGTKKLEVDLAADRQGQVDQILSATNYARGGTPLSSVMAAKDVLKDKGLLPDKEIGTGQIDKSQQYWLVLTTDGNFEHTTADDVAATLETLLQEYSNLQVVYFGIGASGTNAKNVARDFRNDERLKKYPNFTAVYAEQQDQIIATMQLLANRISGRYSVNTGLKHDGNTVTIQVSGETSPIRNIALLAQNTDAKLLSATTEDGEQLTISRAANIAYPRNANYDCVPEGTKGGHTALITSKEGKIPPGTIRLEFSEPVDQNNFSLMYEPAVYVDLAVQYQDASGNWVDVPYGKKVLAEQNLRVEYVVREDGTNTPLDTSKLPGATTARITCGDMTIEAGKPFQLPVGNATLVAEVSMMDGAYVVNAVRSLQVHSLSAYTFDVSDPLEFYPQELAENTTQYIEIKVLQDGKAVPSSQLTDFNLDTDGLEGQVTMPEAGVFRFVPKQDACAVGKYTVSLCFQDQPVASQTVTVKEEVITYSAEAGDGLSMFSNEVASNTKPITFRVTRHRETEETPLARENASTFRIQAVAADGTELKGDVSYEEGGYLQFVANDANCAVGDYAVVLSWQGEELARSRITVLQYNATYTIQVYHTGENTVDRLNLRDNQNGVAFVVLADDVPLQTSQLEAMLNQQLFLTHTPNGKVIRMQVETGSHDGQSALIVTPTTGARTKLGAAFQKPTIALGRLPLGPLDITLAMEAVNGAKATGTLEIVNDPAEWILYLIILFASLFVIGLILWIIWCNLAMPRIAPGTFRYMQIDVMGKNASISVDTQTRHGWRPYFRLSRSPEEVRFGSQVFYADARSFYRTTSPRCQLDADDPCLHDYFFESGFLFEGGLISFLDEVGGQPFPLRRLRSLLPGTPVVEADFKPTEQDRYVYQQIDRGAFLVKKVYQGNARELMQVFIWLYQ